MLALLTAPVSWAIMQSVNGNTAEQNSMIASLLAVWAFGLIAGGEHTKNVTNEDDVLVGLELGFKPESISGTGLTVVTQKLTSTACFLGAVAGGIEGARRGFAEEYRYIESAILGIGVGAIGGWLLGFAASPFVHAGVALKNFATGRQSAPKYRL